MARKRNAPAKRTAVKSASRHEVVVRVEAQPIVTQDDLKPVQDGGKYMIPRTWMSEKQVIKMVQQTPKQAVYYRKGKGGETWAYVTGHYVEKVLNFVFGWNWDFEVQQHGREGDMVWVLGRLTVKDDKGHTITKSQFGRADIKFKRDGKGMLDFGNDLKAATTDSLKKCASLLGIASDIYGKSEYKEETGNDIPPTAPNTPPNVAALPPAPASTTEEPKKEYFCYGIKGSGCPYGNENITKAGHEFSMKVYGKSLCAQCAKDATPLKRK